MRAIEFGLIGHPLGHSLSPFIHQALLEAAGLPGEYRLIDLLPEELADSIPDLLRDLSGFNCTIPFKEAIIPLLDDLDPAAEKFYSVNTVWHGRGYNTDYQAFIDECPAMAGHKIMILGAGGVSRMMAFAAAESGAEICIMARRTEQSSALAAAVRRTYPDCRITTTPDLAEWLSNDPFAAEGQKPWGLLNGTPLGLWPHTSGIPFPPELLSHFSWVFDTIYNPPATRLVLAARSRGIPAFNGLGMLFSQAVAAEKIWHPGLEFAAEDLTQIRSQLAKKVLSQFPTTILLTGFMGSGKTTVGEIIAAQLDQPFVDLDQAIIESANQSITEIFATSGEPVFRFMEREQLTLLLQNTHSQIIATGGGALIDPAAEIIVREKPSLVVYLDTPLSLIRSRVGSGEGRPLISEQGEDRLESLFMQRRARYLALADLRVDGTGTPEEIAAAIIAGLGYEGEKK